MGQRWATRLIPAVYLPDSEWPYCDIPAPTAVSASDVCQSCERTYKGTWHLMAEPEASRYRRGGDRYSPPSA